MNDALLPANPKAEIALVGALLIDPDRCIDVPSKLRGKQFYIPLAGAIFDAIMHVWESSHNVNDLTVITQLKAAGTHEMLGAAGRSLTDYRDECPSEKGVKEYARLVEGSYVKREMIDIAAEMAEMADDETSDPAHVEGIAYARLAALGGETINDATPAAEAVPEAWNELQQRVEHPELFKYPITPWERVNEIYNGCAPGQFHIVAARPAMGKSALADQWAVALAQAGVPTGFFSLEMTKSELIYREASRISGIDSRKIMKANLDAEDMDRVYAAMEQLKVLPLYYDDSSSLSIQAALRKIRLLVLKYKIRVLFIDYVQLMSDEDVENGKRKTREQEIATISRGLKAVAKDVGITVIAVAQLNRSLEHRTDKRPLMADLRESGQLEQDAHVIMFLYRDEYYTGEETTLPGVAEVIFGKNRNGPLGTAILGVALSTLYFYDSKPLEDLVETPPIEQLDAETWDQPVIDTSEVNQETLHAL